MAYIYKIVNDINDKLYIGKTERSLEKRWFEHCKDYKRREYEKRPLYAAMRKYGIEHFHIELIEETDKAAEREIYWIETLGTFKYGYNATKGGDSKRYLDYELILATYKQTNSIAETSRLTGAHIDSIHNILTQYHIPIRSGGDTTKEIVGIPVAMLDMKTEEVIMVFSNQSEAARWLQDNNKTTEKRSHSISSRIGQVTKGKRKTAYGYKWKRI